MKPAILEHLLGFLIGLAFYHFALFLNYWGAIFFEQRNENPKAFSKLLLCSLLYLSSIWLVGYLVLK